MGFLCIDMETGRINRYVRHPKSGRPVRTHTVRFSDDDWIGIAAGREFLDTGDLECYRENPALVNCTPLNPRIEIDPPRPPPVPPRKS